MAKDKKSKSDSKKATIANKKQKQEKKGAKKEKARISKGSDSDADDIALDAVLAAYAKQQEQFLKVTELPCDPPRARASATLIPSPANDNELFLFGGEFYNGALATFFNDMYIYLINKDSWRLVTSPNTPLPRSGHAWCRGGNSGGVYLFGGEFSSPKQGTFHHYNDFWRFEPSNREWTRLEPKGKTPPGRSGHRMTYFKNYIVLFGGFQDTSQNTKYLDDLWLYDTQNFIWHCPALPSSTPKPTARSSFSFLPHDAGAILFGGYSRTKATSGDKQGGKGSKPTQKTLLRPVVHQDCFFLRIQQAGPNSNAKDSLVVRWERRKKPTNVPDPSRAGATMAHHRGRGIMFGGVHDVEESEEGIESEFFNGLFAWNIDRNRFFPLAIRKARAKPAKLRGDKRNMRKGRGEADEEDLLRNLAALQAGTLANTSGDDESDNELSLEKLPEKELLTELPHSRFNAQLAIQNDILYMYGGTYEKGDREFTFDDMYSIDLVKLNGVRQIFNREPENWNAKDMDESEDDSEDETEEEDNLGEDDVPLNQPCQTESVQSPGVSNEEESPTSTVLEETDHSVNNGQDDSQICPRPFESRRDFFQRTGTAWQEALMTNLRWKGIQPESLTVKEIKTKAFEMSEEKWWDCREEIMELEDAQDAAGIEETINLLDKAEGLGGGRRR